AGFFKISRLVSTSGYKETTLIARDEQDAEPSLPYIFKSTIHTYVYYKPHYVYYKLFHELQSKHVAPIDHIHEESTMKSLSAVKPQGLVWCVALLTGLAFAWPMLYAAVAQGPSILIQSIGGDSYQYLTIARKANLFHIYTYDGVHVTNGFHPLWEYSLRGVFAALHLETQESQAIALMLMSLCAATLGVVLASAALVRMTNSSFLAMLPVPGLFYLAIGVHVRSNWIWSVLDGMESA